MNQRITLFFSGLLTVVISVFCIYLLRSQGIIESYELELLDWFFLQRQEQPVSEEIVLVTITEDDIEQLEQYPLSDKKLVQLLERIIKAQPRVIGLDIIRNFPVVDQNLSTSENQLAPERLQAIFRDSNNLYGIAKITNTPLFPSISGSPILEQAGRLAAADLVLDKDGVARRGNLYPDYKQNHIQGLGLAVALKYLEKEGGITLKNADASESKVCYLPQKEQENTKYPQSGWLQLNDHVLCPLTRKFGGYVTHSDSGYQILINWRSCRGTSFRQITLGDILDDNFNRSLVKDRLVLIGNTSISSNDSFNTPCSKNTGNTPKQMAGVEIMAHLAQQIIDIAMGISLPINAWKEEVEIGWIVLWAILMQLIFSKFLNYKIIFFWTFSFITFIFFGVCLYYVNLYFFLVRGIWLPLLPLWLCFLLQYCLTCIIFSFYRLKQNNFYLELKVKERTDSLEEAFKKLQNVQQKMIAQEKLNFLANNAVYLSHEIRNPLASIKLANLISTQYISNLSKIKASAFQNELATFTEILDNCNLIQENISRIDKIIVRLNEQGESNQGTLIDCEINEVVDESLSATIYAFASRHQWTKSIEIETDYTTNLRKVQLYRLDFERALCNLIDNSLYSLKQKHDKNPDFCPKLSLTTKQLGELFEVIIEDNGEGINPEDEKKVMEEFYSTKGIEGTGLGLFIVKQIIEGQHGGKLTLLTKWQEFCRITITIPAEQVNK